MVTPERIAAFLLKLENDPAGAELVNAAWWQAVAERIAELPGDAREQAEQHYASLWELLSDGEESLDGDDA